MQQHVGGAGERDGPGPPPAGADAALWGTAQGASKGGRADAREGRRKEIGLVTHHQDCVAAEEAQTEGEGRGERGGARGQCRHILPGLAMTGLRSSQ